MADPDRYVGLLASLPGIERPLVAKKPPLSRLRLERRLKALAEEDARILAAIEGVLSWNAYGMEDGDEEAFARGRAALAAAARAGLADVIGERLKLRTAVAGLRRRKAGLPPPPAGWGFLGLGARIARGWSEPAFGLERAFPWLPEAARLVERDDALGLERLILTESRRMLRARAESRFDLEAVVLYVLDWDIADRWARANAEAAARRFRALADEALGGRAQLFAES